MFSTKYASLCDSIDRFFFKFAFQVANLGLYAIALVVFGVIKAGSIEDTETQVSYFVLTSPLCIYWSVF